jgi:hypothetical protein
MANIFRPDVCSTLEARVRSLRPDSRRRWGRMSPHQAICHLTDGFRMALGDKPVAPLASSIKPVMRFVALSLPMRWPRNVKTLPEAEQGAGGTPPAEFERDRQELLAMIRRFCDAPPDAYAPEHPMFGPMRRDHWGRWAFRHLDHHLRQFGA